MHAPWGNIHVVVGGQFGSEGKGAFTAALTRKLTLSRGLPPVLVRVAGPNAGHTAYDIQGREWKLRQIPVGAVVHHNSPVVLAAGSEIDLGVLQDEINGLENAGIPIRSRLRVDWNATVIEQHHKDEENGLTPDGLNDQNLIQRIGSTGKGIGAARADRLMRHASLFRQTELSAYYGHPDTADFLRTGLWEGRDVIIEGTQGYGLGLHTPNYPYTTSSDCRAIDFLAMAGLGPWDARYVQPWVVFRNETIRVAGNSGPLLAETSWQDLGLPNEQTTVTKKTRRVGAWDAQLAKNAIANNGGRTARVAYMMADHQYGDLRARTTPPIDKGNVEIVNQLHRRVRAAGADGLSFVGTSPKTGFWLGAADLKPGEDHLVFGEQEEIEVCDCGKDCVDTE